MWSALRKTRSLDLHWQVVDDGGVALSSVLDWLFAKALKVEAPSGLDDDLPAAYDAKDQPTPKSE